MSHLHTKGKKCANAICSGLEPTKTIQFSNIPYYQIIRDFPTIMYPWVELPVLLFSIILPTLGVNFSVLCFVTTFLLKEQLYKYGMFPARVCWLFVREDYS